MSEIIFHIDVNSAYLSWSSVENMKTGNGIDLREIPSIIGGDKKSRHGVVLAKSVPAKAFGIVTGESVAMALKKCPQLVIAPPDHNLYQRYSHQLMNLLHTYTSDIEQLSVDECFLYFTPIAHQFSSPLDAAYHIKNRIHKELGFTVNIGIAHNKLLAKMASDFQKPNRVHTLYMEEIPSKMWPLSVNELYMVGRASATRLHQLGINTIGELAATDQGFLISHFKSHGKQMWEYANGIDPRPVVSEQVKAKGIGNSTTLSKDITTTEAAKKILLSLSETVAGRLRKEHVLAGNLCVEIKYHTFESSSHQSALLSPSNTTDTLYQNACQLFDQLWNGTPIRLLGIRCGKLLPSDTPIQMSIFDFTEPNTDTKKQENLQKALDAIRKRYGENAITRGSLMSPKKE